MAEECVGVGPIEESTLPVPVELVKRFVGISIDIGASLAKLVYRSSKISNEVLNSDSGAFDNLQLVSFSRDNLSSALDYVRQHAVITDAETGQQQQQRPTVFTTGIGCTTNRQTIEDALKIKLHQLTEFDCFINAFTYLAAHLPRSELLEPFLDEAVVEPVEAMKVQLNALKTMEEKGVMSDNLKVDVEGFMKGIQLAVGKPSDEAVKTVLPLADSEPDMFPCILAMCGSGFGFMKVEKDGSFHVVDASARGGRALYGLGSLLTGCKSFEELVELAANGTTKSIDQFSDDLLANVPEAAKGEESIYTALSTDEYKTSPSVIFCFGKTIGFEIGSFRREDLARAWLNYVVLDLVQCINLISAVHGIKRVFFAGSFCNSSLIRSIITTEYVRRNLFLLTFNSSVVPVPFDFLIPGAHLGALGCVIHDVEKSTQP